MKFLTRFHSGQSFAILWCLNWFLQNLANAFSSGEKICWKRTIKNFSTILKKIYLTGFYQKSTLIEPPYFLASAMVNTCQKLSILEKKSKITKKFVKNHDFLEKIWFLWLQLLRIFGGLWMRLPYVLSWLLGEKVQDVWFCGNFSENVNKGCFLSGVHMISKIFLC